jgi:hypothetical protein
MTECNQSTFEFAGHFSRQVVARFDGGTLTTDAGGLLLRETDRRLNLLPRFAECFLDGRNPVFVNHSVEQLVSQRVYGLALGYEDLNDHEQLRQDPLMRVLAGKANVEDSALAGKSTLNRLELSNGTPDRYKKITFWKDGIDELLVKVFLESYATAPEEIVFDVDATDFPLHGEQEGRFFHGYMTATATCRCTSSAKTSFCVRVCGNPTATQRPGVWRRSNASWDRSARLGPR